MLISFYSLFIHFDIFKKFIIFNSLVLASICGRKKVYSILFLHFFIGWLYGQKKASMLFKKVQAHRSWNLVKRRDVFNGSDVEALESIRMEVLAHESGEVIQAVFQVVHGVAAGGKNFWIIPNWRVQLFDGATGNWFKESLVFVSFLKNVDSDEACASSKLGRSILQKGSLVELKLQNLEADVDHSWVLIIIEQSQEPLHALHGSWKVEIEAKCLNYVLFKLDELLFGDVLPLLVGEQVDHSVEAWRNGLLELCCHQNADHSKMKHLSWSENVYTHHHYVVVKNSRSHE